MAFLNKTFSSRQPAALVSAVNTWLAANSDTVIHGLHFCARDRVSIGGIETLVSFTYDTGAALADPFTIQIFNSNRAADLETQANVVMAANPTYFYRGLYVDYLSQNRRTENFYGLLVSNANSAAGAAANWLV